MSLNGDAVLLSSALMWSCTVSAPETKVADINDPRCAGTAVENACIVLEITVDPAVRTEETHALQGTVHWALYRAGDVSILGPGVNKSLYGGAIPDVDLAAASSSATVVIPNAVAESYQALGYFDVLGDGSSNVAETGDPVTFPSNPIAVPAGKLTEVSIVFDFIR